MKQIIAFDADDTLWENMTDFREAEKMFASLMSDYGSFDEINDILFGIEMKNMEIYGYGVKAFILSMVEAALQISDNKIDPTIIAKITDRGREMLYQKPVLLPDVKKVLNELKARGYKLIVATKGDLLDQERKLVQSGLESYFHHIEVMSDKKPTNYQKLLNHLDIDAKDFIMIGNSMKSDVVPVIELGGIGIHVPFHTTWAHEEINEEFNSEHLYECEQLEEVLGVIE